MHSSDTRIEGKKIVAAEAYPAYRWVILLIAWLGYLLSFVDRLAWSSVALYVGPSLKLSVAELGIFVTAFYIGYVVMNALGGLTTDWLGGRRMLTMALLPLGVFTFLFGFTQSLVMGLVIQVLMGLAAGADYAACIKLLISWFRMRDRGTAMGLFMTASSLGVFVTNAIVPSILKWANWQGVYQVLGGITIVIAIVGYLVLREGPISGQAAQVKQRPDFGLLLRNHNLLFLALAGFGALWGTWGFTYWANILMIKGHHLSTMHASFIVSLFGIGAITAKPLVGLLSDWLGGIRKIPIIIILAAFVVVLVIFGSLNTLTAFEVMAPLLGIAAFVYSPLMNAMVPEIAGRSVVGSSAGITNAFWQLGSAIVPTVVGIVFASTKSFALTLIVLALGPLFGLICMLPVREVKQV